MIEVKNLSKSFGDKSVLKDINLTISTNKSLVILGPSGTGKSVLVKVIIGILEADAGSSIKIDGAEITNLRQRDRLKLMKDFAFLFQYGALFDSMTVRENLLIAMSKNITPHEKQKKVEDLLNKVELDLEVMNLCPSSLSGGMQKRVALARALASDPKYIILDEPITGLDPMTAAKIDHMIFKLVKEKNLTAITITHSVESTKIMGEEIIFLLGHGIHWRGNKEDFTNTKDEKLLEFMYAYDMQAN